MDACFRSLDAIGACWDWEKIHLLEEFGVRPNAKTGGAAGLTHHSSVEEPRSSGTTCFAEGDGQTLALAGG